MPSLETVSTSEVKPTDVLFSKGLKQFKNHPGSIALKGLIDANVVNYLNPKSESCDKTFLTVDIVERVLIDGGRFLVQSDTAIDEWVVLDKESGRQKVRNAFRNSVKGGKLLNPSPIIIGFAVQVQSNDRFSSLVMKILQDPFMQEVFVSTCAHSTNQTTKTRKRQKPKENTSLSKRRRHDIQVDPIAELCLPRCVQSEPSAVAHEGKMGLVDGKWQFAPPPSVPTYNTDHHILGLYGPEMKQPFHALSHFDPNHSLVIMTAIQNCLNTPFDARHSAHSNGLLGNLSDTCDVLEHLRKAEKLLEGEDYSHDDAIFGINFDIENTSRDDMSIPDENVLADLDLDDLDNFHSCFKDNKGEESCFSTPLFDFM
jgi:hypothetical protein